MTTKQFKNHKWKIGETVWMQTYKKLNGFYINAYRMVEAKVSSILYYVDGNGSSLYKIILLPTNKLEEYEYPIQRDYFDKYEYNNNTCNYIFTSKRTADKALITRQKNDDVKYRAGKCLSDFEERLNEMKEAVDEIKRISIYGL